MSWGFDIKTAALNVVFLTVRGGGGAWSQLTTLSSLWGCGMLGLGQCLPLMANACIGNEEQTLTSETSPAHWSTVCICYLSVTERTKTSILWYQYHNTSAEYSGFCRQIHQHHDAVEEIDLCLYVVWEAKGNFNVTYDICLGISKYLQQRLVIAI